MMDDLNKKWLELAAKGYLIEVSPRRVALIDTNPLPEDPEQQTNPDVGGWGREWQIDLPIKVPEGPGKGGYDVEIREWWTTVLVVIQPYGVASRARYRGDFREAHLEYKASVKMAAQPRS
jgi:hypothetical protein